VQGWLLEAVLASAAALPAEVRGHAMGRGLKGALVDEMRMGVWVPPATPSPDPTFNHRNGPYGQYRESWLTVPYWTPRGRLVGIEFRTWDQPEKEVRDYRMPEGQWVSAFIGLTPSATRKIWEGGDVWLVEGVFDIALQHAVPEGDVVLACGTARLSRQGLLFLQRFLDPRAMVHVAYDNDPTGRRQLEGFTDDATGRWIPGVPARLERVGVRNRPVHYRGGKDPGEIWEAGGTAALARAFNL